MKNDVFKNISAFILIIAAVFINPILFQWFWNSAIVDCINFIFPEFLINSIGYWIAFLMTNIIATFISFFYNQNKDNESTDASFEEGLSVFLGRELSIFFSVLVCVILTNIII